MVVLGQFADGLERDVTGRSAFGVSDSGLAAVDAEGLLRALADGEVEMSAVVGEQSAKTTVRVEGASERRPFSFQRDIGRILTRHGCNTSDCHGGVRGQGGFKLSLQTLIPRDDYKWIIEGGTFKVLTDEQDEPPQPRINREDPAQSPLLLKPTGKVAHGGGKRFEVGSGDYETILNWIKDGAPFGEEDGGSGALITRIEVFPEEVVLDRQGRWQLLVTAVFSDGRREDLTGEVRYASNNTVVADVTAGGVVEALRTGETSVMVRAAGHVASARIGVIAEPLAEYPPAPPPRNFIDEHTFAKMRKFNLAPAGLSSDEEFLRRVCLDVCGMLPPPGRVREFLADPDPDKRDKLIEDLLSSPQYNDFWIYRFGDLFRVAYTPQRQMDTTWSYFEWMRNAIIQNHPYDRIARERIAWEGTRGPLAHAYKIQLMRTPEAIAAEQTRVFHGIRIDCAKCHNHPFEAWTQDQYWGLAAFYSQLTVMSITTARFAGDGMLLDFPEGMGERSNGRTVTHPRTKESVRPAFLDGGLLTGAERENPRMRLAEWMTAPSNPYFAKAAVNRMWGWFFGRGIVDPVDDFRSSNPPTHPELLDALARDFVEHGYDIKHLIRTIVQSRTYQMSSSINATNRDDRINFSRAVPRRIESPVLLDAISDATGTPQPPVYHKVIGGGPAPVGTRVVQMIPDLLPSQFLDVFGRNNRHALPIPHEIGTVAQGLHMLAGDTFNERISREGGRSARLLESGADDQAVIEDLYLATLSRFPSDKERSVVGELIASGPSREESVQSLTWALICSREFGYNH